MTTQQRIAALERALPVSDRTEWERQMAAQGLDRAKIDQLVREHMAGVEPPADEPAAFAEFRKALAEVDASV